MPLWKSNTSARSAAPRPLRQAGPVLVALLAAFSAGCASFSPWAPPPLFVGVVENSPPMVFRSGRQWSGLESDLARAYAARLGLRPVFVALPADRLPDALFDGRIDVVMAGLPITEANRVRMDFSSPYLVVGLGAAVRPADLPRFNTDIKIRSARGRVGVVEGSRGDAFVSSYFPHAQRAAFDSLADAENDLAEGQIDLLVHDAPSIWWSIRNRDSALAMAPVLFDRVEIAWGFRRGSVGLRESANRALADWQKDGSLEAAIARWLPVSR